MVAWRFIENNRLASAIIHACTEFVAHAFRVVAIRRRYAGQWLGISINKRCGILEQKYKRQDHTNEFFGFHNHPLSC